ncbi:MAG: MarC family protein [Reinekea sp.]|nr:MarC family protein [Reinekea sp.]
MNSTFFFNALTSYFVVIDPIGCALIFYSLTLGQSTRLKAKTMATAMCIAFGIILMFALFGETLLTALGIEMDALRIAGGILLFNTAFRMITAEPTHEQPHDVRVGHITVYPLAIPLMAGPGTLTLTVLLMAGAPAVVDQVMVIVAALMTLTVTLLLALISSQLRKWLGKTGDEIIQRLLGVLLAALAIQFVANGISGLFLSGA